MPEDDPKQRQPNIELAEKLLGWRPAINLDEGLNRTVAYFEALLREHGKSITSGKQLQSARLRLTYDGGENAAKRLASSPGQTGAP